MLKLCKVRIKILILSSQNFLFGHIFQFSKKNWQKTRTQRRTFEHCEFLVTKNLFKHNEFEHCECRTQRGIAVYSRWLPHFSGLLVQSHENSLFLSQMIGLSLPYRLPAIEHAIQLYLPQ